MKFISTRLKSPALDFAGAIEAGLASDGGLYVPESWPQLDLKQFQDLSTLDAVASKLISPFVDDLSLKNALPGLCVRALNFSTPLTKIDDTTEILELYHGPTLAFKDVGARFLAGVISHLAQISSKPRTVLVATSGDTGAAVASAFFKQPGTEVIVLFPNKKISPRQERQLTCWGENVHSFAVNGTFDDCQRMVKEAFLDPWFQKNKTLISANSINIGRLLPQAAYFALTALQFKKQNGQPANFIIPTGNLGNGLSCLWAKKMGFSIGKVVLATNANKAIPSFFESEKFVTQKTIPTLANAMDVGNPSNLERLQNLYPDFETLQNDVSSESVSDEEIKETIKKEYCKTGIVVCPHTATALSLRRKIKTGHWIVVATAHPAKFETAIEPIVGRVLEVPQALQDLLQRPSRFSQIDATLEALRLKLE